MAPPSGRGSPVQGNLLVGSAVTRAGAAGFVLLGGLSLGIAEFGAACESARTRDRLELGQGVRRCVSPGAERPKRKARRAAREISNREGTGRSGPGLKAASPSALNPGLRFTGGHLFLVQTICGGPHSHPGLVFFLNDLLV